jgi:putative DNA primase/helicase
VKTPPANDNLNDDLIRRTRQAWQPRLGRDLSREDARRIATNMTGLFSVLAEWSRAERPAWPTIRSRPPPPRRRRLRMNAETIAGALGGRRAGGGWTARCPAHDDRNPSLSIRDAGGKLLVRCHAGCEQERVIAALRGRGLWTENRRGSPSQTAGRKPVERQPDRGDARRTEAALAIWQCARPARGTQVAAYLASRGIDLPPPDALRVHAGLQHPSGGTWPAMVALVTAGADGTPVAVHRTFLARDGKGKAPVDPPKMMLGPCRGGAVRLAEPGEALMVGEGLETCLAAMQATGHAAWAALSTSGLRSLDLPAGVRDVIVLADGDEAGEAAARGCALRWRRPGRRVRIARPPRGMDFNDLLSGRAPRVEAGAQ